MVNIPYNPYMDDMGPEQNKTSNGRPVIQRISETREMPFVASQVCASYWWVADLSKGTGLAVDGGIAWDRNQGKPMGKLYT